MKKQIFTIIAVFILMTTSSAISGDITVYSGTGQHQTGEFIESNIEGTTVISKEEPPPPVSVEKKKKEDITIIVKPKNNLQKNSYPIYSKRRWLNDRPNKPMIPKTNNSTRSLMP